jgi:hypothetical protein
MDLFDSTPENDDELLARARASTMSARLGRGGAGAPSSAEVFRDEFGRIQKEFRNSLETQGRLIAMVCSWSLRDCAGVR